MKKWLWITDPWTTLDHPRDTSLRLIQEALSFGIPQYWCDVKSIRLEAGRVLLDAQQVLAVNPERGDHSFKLGDEQFAIVTEFSSIHYRTDPPVDLAYFHPLQLLGLALRNINRTEFINPMKALFFFNEKIEAAAIADLMPPSLVSSQLSCLSKFGKKEGRTVLKPLHQAQSQGVELLDWRSSDSADEAPKIMDKLKQASYNFTRPVLLQRFLEGIRSDGETRLWFLDGRLLAHVKKHPVPGDFRVNMDRGSPLKAAELLPYETKHIPKISKHLKKHKIRLAAVDLVEGYVTDFNITSPGLIPLMESLLKENLARKIVKRLQIPWN